MFGQRACHLLREVHGVSAENIPPFNDEVLQQVKEEINEHNKLMSSIFMEVQQQQAESDQEGGGDWKNLPDEACAVLVHHDSILRNKRILLAYMNQRMGAIKEMWWRSRTLSDDFKAQLGPLELEFYENYDKLMNKYMSRRHGIDLTLTVDIDPPKDPSIQVRCVKDHGDVEFSIGKVILAKDTAHLLPREEAEPFIHSGVLVQMD